MSSLWDCVCERLPRYHCPHTSPSACRFQISSRDGWRKHPIWLTACLKGRAGSVLVWAQQSLLSAWIHVFLVPFHFEGAFTSPGPFLWDALGHHCEISVLSWTVLFVFLWNTSREEHIVRIHTLKSGNPQLYRQLHIVAAATWGRTVHCLGWMLGCNTGLTK